MSERRGPQRPVPGPPSTTARGRPRTWARAPRPRRPAPARWLAAGLVIGACSGFLFAKATTAPPAAAEAPQTAVLSNDAGPSTGPIAGATTVATSTAGLCPCPAPRRPRATATVVPKRRAPIATPPFSPPDPTAETARYLREEARALGECAPPVGGELRAHLEVTVAPTGVIEGQRITNVEPLPGDVSRCIEARVAAWSPPAFDGTASEVFALTVVL